MTTREIPLSCKSHESYLGRMPPWLFIRVIDVKNPVLTHTVIISHNLPQRLGNLDPTKPGGEDS